MLNEYYIDEDMNGMDKNVWASSDSELHYLVYN